MNSTIRLIFLFIILSGKIFGGYSRYPSGSGSGGHPNEHKSDSMIIDDQHIINGIAVPVDFPGIDVSVADSTAPGYLFMTNKEGPPYIVIFENDGTPYYYERLQNSSAEFKVNPNGLLSRTLLDVNLEPAGYITMDKNFQIQDTIRAADGFTSDIHESLILPNGHYFIIAISYQTRDMSQVVPGGNPNAVIKGNHIQEFDSTKQLVFSWECWDNFDVADSYINLRDNLLDYVHMNSIDVDYDGNLLISSRHLSECTKINRQTGEIIWRLGGKNNQFTFINDSVMISYQHDLRHVEGKPGHYTIFDNGNQHSPSFSRVVEYLLDAVEMTATKIWEYRMDPDQFSISMGNAQRLGNGNTLMNWAQSDYPQALEVDPDGEIVYNARFKNGYRSYRTFRFEWNEQMETPYLIAEKYPERIRLLFNQFGDTIIRQYRIFAGIHPDTLALIDSTENTWIEPENLSDSTWIFFRVSSIHHNGEESGLSNLDSAFTYYILPGGNIVFNGDFSMQKNHWDLSVKNPATANGEIENGEYLIDIGTSGAENADVTLKQQLIPLVQGRRYELQFDAYADTPGAIDVDIATTRGYISDHSKIGYVYIPASVKHFAYSFEMLDPTDLNAELAFRLGKASGSFHFDNVSLQEVLSPITVIFNDTSDISCHGYSDGMISVTAKNGVGTISYMLLPDSTINTSGIFPISRGGTYSLEISDESIRDPLRTKGIQIDEPDSLVIDSIRLDQPSTIGGEDGRIVIFSSGGSGMHSYCLFPDSSCNDNGIFTDLDTGYYQVLVNDEKACGPVVSDSLLLAFTVSVNEVYKTEPLSIYPNPATDHLIIIFSKRSIRPALVKIYSQTGTLVENHRIKKEFLNGNKYRLNLDRLPPGLYYVSIIYSEVGSGRYTLFSKKLVVN